MQYVGKILKSLRSDDMVRRASHCLSNYRAIRKHSRRDQIFFADELAWLLGCDRDWLRETLKEYRRSPHAWSLLCRLRSPSRSTDGYTLSLDVAEGFVAWALVKALHPRVVVELGTQLGVSARLWKEALLRYVPDHKLILVDVEDSRIFIEDSEAVFIQEDGMKAFPRILEEHRVDLLFNDAHPRDLIWDSVGRALSAGVRALVFHDVGHKHPRGPFRSDRSVNPRLSIRDPEAGTLWERHAMAAFFGQELLEEERVSNESGRAQIFDSLFGLGVVLPHLSGSEPRVPGGR